MRKLIFISMTSLLLVLSAFAYAIDFIWKDDQGIKYYDCGGTAVAGQAEVKGVGNGMYRVRGIRLNRVIKANSAYHAAQIVCGEKKEMPRENSERKNE
ncbi:MAG: hypothetical protein GY866_11460 [Proteobacteria bacterium]|nr:hypothetical protein [Pseudomonadota bacterium]